MTVPTARAARDPIAAATSLYAMALPGGMEPTTSSTAEMKSSGGLRTERECADVLAVLGLAHDGEADAEEELLRALFAGLPDGGQALEAAAAQAQPWLLGGHFTQADVSVAVAWRFIQFTIADLVPAAAYPALSAWSVRAEGLPEFASTPLD